MRTGPKTATVGGILLAAALCGGLGDSGGATIGWHIVTNGSPPTSFLLNPPDPTATNAITFVAPTDGKVYVNSCFASVSCGNPQISVDPTNRTIIVSFSARPTNAACPLFVLLVSGVDGELGLLRAGTWDFQLHQGFLFFSFPFTVSEAPMPLSMGAVSNSSALQIEWPASGDNFVLEFNQSLAPGNWQIVTNPPVTVGNQNSVQIESDSAARFFRLRRQP